MEPQAGIGPAVLFYEKSVLPLHHRGMVSMRGFEPPTPAVSGLGLYQIGLHGHEEGDPKVPLNMDSHSIYCR